MLFRKYSATASLFWITAIIGGAVGASVLFDAKDAQTSVSSTAKPGVLAPQSRPKPAEPEPQALVPVIETREVGRGDTLANILQDAGAERVEAHEAIQALKKYYDPRKIKPGQKISLVYEPALVTGRKGAFQGFTITVDYEKEIRVARVDPTTQEGTTALKDGKTFNAEEVVTPLKTRTTYASGEIKESLVKAGTTAGVPYSVLIKLIRIYSWDVDFQRDIRKGDKFEVFFEQLEDSQGEVVGAGEVLYANLTVRSEPMIMYGFKQKNGRFDHFDEKGHSVRKVLMKTPVEGARLTSGYGRRRHPVLGYTRMHRGLDFGASRGTPVYAAGDGTITMAGWNGGYGRYVKIHHNGSYSTAYAHLNSFAHNIRKGARVRQGQVIAYVGSTGMSTGPHLHYEIHYKGRQINPLKLKLPEGKKLKGEDLARFQQLRDRVDEKVASLRLPAKVARRGGAEENEAAEAAEAETEKQEAAN